jgi:hypothetical protein
MSLFLAHVYQTAATNDDLSLPFSLDGQLTLYDIGIWNDFDVFCPPFLLYNPFKISNSPPIPHFPSSAWVAAMANIRVRGGICGT